MVSDGLQVTSFLPGRVRIKVDEIRHAPVFADRVRQRLQGVPGIRRVETNDATGSVLVIYDVGVIARAEGRQPLRQAIHELFPAVDLAQLDAWLDRASW
jgi:hypothetical protein